MGCNESKNATTPVKVISCIKYDNQAAPPTNDGEKKSKLKIEIVRAKIKKHISNEDGENGKEKFLEARDQDSDSEFGSYCSAELEVGKLSPSPDQPLLKNLTKDCHKF
ncbi:hypothetical protein ACFE04_029664 [Oxalis oulophora]